MKKILISLGVIGAVAAIAVGGTIAYFSDTETSSGNTFTAGTIDISIDGQNPWTDTFTMADMKPGYTDYINFKIENDKSDPNPVNVWKKLYNIGEVTETVSEPECTEQNGDSAWDGQGCTGGIDNNNLSSVIWYDLYIEVYDGSNNLLFWQTIYDDDDHRSIDNIFGGGKQVYLGMIPAGGYMLVEQSYQMKPVAGNEYQGDVMTFDIDVYAEQLHGTAWLENKEGPEPWHLVFSDDGIKGTLTYEVKHPTFDFSFTGRAPLTNHNYVLAAGMESVGGNNYDVDTYLGSGTTDGSGNIIITGDVDTGDMKDVKVWLVPAENWSDGMVWAGWPGIVPNFLWETGLIWYEDTDL